MQTGRGIRNAGSGLALGLAHYTKTSGQVTGAATHGLLSVRQSQGGSGRGYPLPPTIFEASLQPASSYTPTPAGSVWLWRPLSVAAGQAGPPTDGASRAAGCQAGFGLFFCEFRHVVVSPGECFGLDRQCSKGGSWKDRSFSTQNTLLRTPWKGTPGRPSEAAQTPFLSRGGGTFLTRPSDEHLLVIFSVGNESATRSGRPGHRIRSLSC